jgi:hypothetical protein
MSQSIVSWRLFTVGGESNRSPTFREVCAKFKPLASHGTPWHHSKILHRCDTRRHGHRANQQRGHHRVFQYQQVFYPARCFRIELSKHLQFSILFFRQNFIFFTPGRPPLHVYANTCLTSCHQASIRDRVVDRVWILRFPHYHKDFSCERFSSGCRLKRYGRSYCSHHLRFA